jgi:hypothetical protein
MATDFVTRPDLAGIFFSWEGEDVQTVPPSFGKTAFVVGTSDWGPVNTPTLETSLSAFRQDFGTSLSELGINAYNVFKGQGLNGRGGAQAIWAYRMAASALKATHTFMNTAGTPANALTLSGKYAGTKGNTITATVQAGGVAGTQQLIVMVGGAVVETYTYTSTGAAPLAALAAQVNARSAWVTATVVADGTSLATVSNVALSGGTDGTTVAGTDWTNAMAQADTERWAVFFTSTTDAPTITSIKAWHHLRNANGSRSFLVYGGVIDETLAAGTTDSTATNDPDVLRVGVGRLHDTVLNLDMSTAQAAGRYAGARCFRGEREDDIFVRFADLELVSGLNSLTDQATAKDAGLIGFSRDTNAVAPVFIREARTTYSNDSASPVYADGTKKVPADLWGSVKNIAIQHGVEQDAQDWATSGEVLGHIPINNRGRAIVVGFYKQAYSVREQAEVVQPGWTVVINDDPPPSDDDDFIFVRHGFHPTRSARQILNVAAIG